MSSPEDSRPQVYMPDEVYIPGESDLPQGFDPTSDEQLSALTKEQLRSNVAAALSNVLEGSGDPSDIAYGLLPLETDLRRADASEEERRLAIGLMRELVRRAVHNPELGITQEFLYGEQNG